ncbi:uncharacterized protein L969DRAFT_83037 [Mixia osmundae IAM 14324]|uniref:uncharacterized protein n=1 Tax=Mixia osmundae (strain CBS 9802 / IAM 14324 / JCM 22182 / KY 12970) TaxID=764103 RepID=UPI0004A551A5|nr:uncharacterized protein L969DRAFT_83037 [Mixia osmundae IAM 14324]KEI37723.1 hypothetical protein L969DRAFT_83037 [Mixia osmundae IAM 14324]
MTTTALECLYRRALEHSQAVFVHDAGALDLPKVDAKASKAPIFDIQSRPGAGSTLLGYLADVVASSDSTSQLPVTIIASPAAFELLVPALTSLDQLHHRPRLSLIILAAAPGLQSGTLALTTGADAIGRAIQHLFDSGSDEEFEIRFSGGSGQGASELLLDAAANEKLLAEGKDVIHIIEALSAAREWGHYQLPTGPGVATPAATNYIGPQEPETVLVLPSSLDSALAIGAWYSAQQSSVQMKLGVFVVAQIRPWPIAALKDLPFARARVVHVISSGRDDQWLLRELSSLLPHAGSSKGSAPSIQPLVLGATERPTLAIYASLLATLASAGTPNIAFDELTKVKVGLASLAAVPSSAHVGATKLITFWDTDAGPLAALPRMLAQSVHDEGMNARLVQGIDRFAGKEAGRGVSNAQMLLSPGGQAISKWQPGDVISHPLDAVADSTPPSFVMLASPQSILGTYSAFEQVGPHTQVLCCSSWSADDFREKLNNFNKSKLADRPTGSLWSLHVDGIAKSLGAHAVHVAYAAFWIMFLRAPGGHKADAGANVTSSVAQLLRSLRVDGDVEQLVQSVRDGIQLIELPKEGEGQPAAPAEVDQASPESLAPLPGRLSVDSFEPSSARVFPEPQPESQIKPREAAKRLIFPELYQTVKSERPDLSEDNFLLTVTENRRLTPLDYDRNVFHIEFSTKGTGLKYAVGEALGVHGWNDPDEVAEFLEWYNLNPDQIVDCPSATKPGTVEQRTVYQAFMQNLDIFGKPPKSFYEALSTKASDLAEARHLRFIASAEGSSTFKKWSELETVTYADVLKAFPSAMKNVGLIDLLREVSPIKPRHYSIASSQNFVGESVHLLVVTVDWATPKGVTRYGQCTRYLAALPVGAKLPPLDTQPIIMAGLGTGAAPFRAFIQERAWQKSQGIEVGELLYYFGSREELEAYLQDGVVTRLGLAFSRDTSKKVYIQHKMVEDGSQIADLLVNKKALFTLCGPTWPVPDVYEALCNALVTKGKSLEEAQAYIEELKEDERYVLEVY